MLDTEDTRAVRRQATRTRILAAAWRLARRRGLASLSLRDIARAVGMRAPSLYTYFDSKHAIYDAMFAQGMRELAERVASVPPKQDPVALLHTATAMFLQFCVEHPARYQLLFQRTIPDFEPTPESYAISVALLEQTREALAAVGAADHLDLFTGITGGLAAQQNANEPGGDRWVRLSDEAVDMFLAHVRRKKRNTRKGGRR